MRILTVPILAVALVLLLDGCFTGAAPMQRVGDAARETNLSTRFGQVELAIRHVDPPARADFMSRRAQWGRQIRVLEAETAGITLLDEEHAVVAVEVSWSSVTDSLLRTTQLEQSWENKKSGWMLVRERRLGGDTGLFGEVLTTLEPPRPDVHLPSRTLGRTGN
jgi:hypothetical protein